MNRLLGRFDSDQHLRHRHLRRYLAQCALAGLVVLILLMVLDAMTQTVLIAALGASAFIAFAVPRSLHSAPRYLVGGYLVGTAAGVLMSVLEHALRVSDPTYAHALMVLFGACSISLAMFLMVVTRTEHPPAAALALGLVLNEWDLLTIAVVLGGVVSLSLFKRLVLPYLMDLL